MSCPTCKRTYGQRLAPLALLALLASCEQPSTPGREPTRLEQIVPPAEKFTCERPNP